MERRDSAVHVRKQSSKCRNEDKSSESLHSITLAACTAKNDGENDADDEGDDSKQNGTCQEWYVALTKSDRAVKRKRDATG